MGIGKALHLRGDWQSTTPWAMELKRLENLKEKKSFKNKLKKLLNYFKRNG